MIQWVTENQDLEAKILDILFTKGINLETY